MIQCFPRSRRGVRDRHSDANPFIDGIGQKRIVICDPGIFFAVSRSDVIEKIAVAVTKNGRIVGHASVPGGGIGAARKHFFDKSVGPAHRF